MTPPVGQSAAHGLASAAGSRKLRPRPLTSPIHFVFPSLMHRPSPRGKRVAIITQSAGHKAAEPHPSPVPSGPAPTMTNHAMLPSRPLRSDILVERDAPLRGRLRRSPSDSLPRLRCISRRALTRLSLHAPRRQETRCRHQIRIGTQQKPGNALRCANVDELLLVYRNAISSSPILGLYS